MDLSPGNLCMRLRATELTLFGASALSFVLSAKNYGIVLQLYSLHTVCLVVRTKHNSWDSFIIRLLDRRIAVRLALRAAAGRCGESRRT